ncbi:MAG: transposase [Methanobrevibacter sp.]|jgi:transposase-like protein|nr:transposase [Methanobrevibacter sp.]
MNRIPNPDIEVPDEKVAMAFFRSIRWVNGVYCPKCKSYNINNRGIQGRTRRYSCKDCGSNFNDFTGTFFHKSKIPLGIMLYILFNLDNKTTTQLSEELDYSRQCISRISKLFRDKLLTNPEYFDFDEEQ